MRKLIVSIVTIGALASASTAQAQGWGLWFGSRPIYNGYAQPADDDGWARSVCSGQRGHMMEDRLRHEVEEGEIDLDFADRMHTAIDKLEDKARHECDEGDRRGIWGISQRFDRIQQWIENEAHGENRRSW